MTSSDPMADSLLVHAAFVQRLARGLAGQDGDDLAQDTWLTAFGRSRDGVRNEPGWLATIAANLWRNRRRAATRRQQHEATAGAGVEEPSVASILEREEVRRQVVAAVMALPEKLRRVVLLRFFEGLDSFAIGRRLDVPAATVRAQLQQALAMLRQRLDAAHGDRRAAWAGPLAAFTAVPGSSLGVLLRIAWPARLAAGCLAALALAWLAAPLWQGGPAASVPLATPVEVASTGRAPEPDGPATAERTIAANSVAVDETRGPEHLWGRVVAATDGTPIAGAEVELEHRDGDEMTSQDEEYGERRELVGTARSNADGRFAFRVQRALQHRLVVQAPGFATVREIMCTGGSEFVVQLHRAAFVDGFVRDLEGAPLADVLVEARVSNTTNPGPSVRTSADGSFFLPCLSPGPTNVMVRPPGRLPPPYRTVELVAGTGAHVEFAVAPGRTARGVVCDAESGQPVAGARVSTSATFADAAVSADDGTYELRGLDERVMLYVRADGYAEATERVFGTDTPFQLDLALMRGYAVTGRVVDATGRALAGAYVAATAEGKGKPTAAIPRRHIHWLRGTVGTDGHFRVEGLLAGPLAQVGPWLLFVRAPGHGAREIAIPRATVRADHDVGDVVLETHGILEGRVVDPDGRAVARAEITLQDFATKPGQEGRPHELAVIASRTTRSSGDGTFRFAGLGASTYTVFAARPRKYWSVRSGLHDVAAASIVSVPDLVLDPGLTIEGRVRVDLLPALPVGSSLFVSVLDEAGNSALSEVRRARVAPDGTFCLERLTPGTYKLSVSSLPRGYVVVPRTGIAAGTKSVELVPVTSAIIEGVVVDADGKATLDVNVFLETEGDQFPKTKLADAEGRFRFDVEPGFVGTVKAIAPGQGWSQELDVTAGARDVRLQLPKSSARR